MLRIATIGQLRHALRNPGHDVVGAARCSNRLISTNFGTVPFFYHGGQWGVLVDGVFWAYCKQMACTWVVALYESKDFLCIHAAIHGPIQARNQFLSIYLSIQLRLSVLTCYMSWISLSKYTYTIFLCMGVCPFRPFILPWLFRMACPERGSDSKISVGFSLVLDRFDKFHGIALMSRFAHLHSHGRMKLEWLQFPWLPCMQCPKRKVLMTALAVRLPLHGWLEFQSLVRTRNSSRLWSRQGGTRPADTAPAVRKATLRSIPTGQVSQEAVSWGRASCGTAPKHLQKKVTTITLSHHKTIQFNSHGKNVAQGISEQRHRLQSSKYALKWRMGFCRCSEGNRDGQGLDQAAACRKSVQFGLSIGKFR